MRVVILTNRQGNQIALANKISKVADVAGIVFSKNIPKRRPPAVKRARLFANAIASRTVGRQFVDVWFEMQRKYGSLFRDISANDVTEVQNVNDAAALDTIERLKPDLVVVSGTNLVGRRVIEAGQKGMGIVNLHTGVSPYVKGGPNCTNWCLAKNWFHLIGSTIMWLDLGIDTGNIIATEQTPLTGEESLFDLHWAVMEHAHDLYVRAIARLAAGVDVPSIPQSAITEGSHFESAAWNAIQMRAALRNFRSRYKQHFVDPKANGQIHPGLRLFPLADA
jgi:methionyl-tRNA formyltransferase